DSDLNYGISHYPYFEDGEVATPTGSWSIGLSNYSNKKEAAADFIKYLTIDEGADIVFEEGDTLPVHNDIIDSILEDPEYDEFPENVLKVSAEESMETASPRPLSPGFLEWDSNMSKAFEE